MDDFGLDRSELTGNLVSMEFGSGGRIQQLWVADPMMREESEEFQFVLPPMSFGEEVSEDYNPGTILLGARTNPDEPWVLSRNTTAMPNESLEGSPIASFDYDFALLPEISATGRFFEVPGPAGVVNWQLKLINKGRISLEIGELGFPFALYNMYEGFARTDRGAEDMYRDRLYVHPFIGGSASYLFAQRLSAEPPGLLITPGENTEWELFTHVPASLQTPLHWEGIPVVYVHSRAAVEREGWGDIFPRHTAKVLEPGDSLEVSTLFMSAARDRFDGLYATMALARRPSMRIFPGAVAPSDVGIAVEVAGATPTRFFTDAEAELETDSDEDGGFCMVRPHEPGPVTLSFEDTEGRLSHAYFKFIEPIGTLIKKRAEFMMRQQLFEDPGSNLDGAFLPFDSSGKGPITDPAQYITPSGIENILGEALYLAEKNRVYPDKTQIAALEAFVTRFLQANLQNPGTGAVASAFMDSASTGVHFGRPQVYPMVALLYHALSRISRETGTSLHDAAYYLSQAQLTMAAMKRHADPLAYKARGLPLMSLIAEIAEDYEAEAADDWPEWPELDRDADLGDRQFPVAGSQSAWDLYTLEEVHREAVQAGNHALEQRVMSSVFAARSTAPAWWWYGSDKRWTDDVETLFNPYLEDKGELCLGPSTPMNSEAFFRSLKRDAVTLPDPMMRMAFGGMLGVWALVQPDGSASSGYCPDPASRHFGMNPNSGSIGLSLFLYLRNVSAYLLPSPTTGALSFGCTFDAREREDGMELRVKPWDGVGRRVIVRQVGLEVQAKVGKIREVRTHTRKRHAYIEIENTATTHRTAHVLISGLWGTVVEVNGKKEHTADGILSLERPVAPGGVITLEVNVIA